MPSMILSLVMKNRRVPRLLSYFLNSLQLFFFREFLCISNWILPHSEGHSSYSIECWCLHKVSLLQNLTVTFTKDGEGATHGGVYFILLARSAISYESVKLSTLYVTRFLVVPLTLLVDKLIDEAEVPLWLLVIRLMIWISGTWLDTI